MPPDKAESIVEVRESIESFARALASSDPKSEFALFHPEYWVHDPEGDRFAPAKWAAYKGMTATEYKGLQDQQREDTAPGFRAGIARDHLARLLGSDFVSNPDLGSRLRTKFVSAFGEERLANRSLDAFKFISLPQPGPRFWWVNQSSFEEARETSAIWADTGDGKRTPVFHHLNVSLVSRGDIVFSYSKGRIVAASVATESGRKAKMEELRALALPEKDMWLAKVRYISLKKPVDLDKIWRVIRNLDLDKSPIDRTGGVNQGYLYEIGQQGAQAIVEHMDPTEQTEDLKAALKMRSAATPTRPRRYWKFAPADGARLWPEFRDTGIIAMGYEQIPDLLTLKSPEAIEKALRKAYPDMSDRKIDYRVKELSTLVQEIVPGDIVIANRGLSVVVGRGEVKGTYEHQPKRKEYPHSLPVRWFDTTERPVGDQGNGWQRTLVELTPEHYEKLFDGVGKPAQEGIVGREDVYAALRESGLRFPAELVTTYLLSLKTKPFVILSGISGTGKTKLAQAIAEWAGTEVREETSTEPAEPPATPGSARWVYQLKPYNFTYRRVVIAKEFEPLLELPGDGSIPVGVKCGEKIYQSSLGTWGKSGRSVYQLLFKKDLFEAFFQVLKPDDYVAFSIERGSDEKQIIRIDQIQARRTTRKVVERRYEFISVRPDWLDGKDVLGYYNVLSEEYQPRPFLDLVLRAHADRTKPYFAILDEMNLARVEHYFSDLLSAAESRKMVGNDVHQEPIYLHDSKQCIPLAPPEGWTRPAACGSCKASREEVDRCPLRFDSVQMVPPRLPIPTNLYVTGTVNVDETTHMFSPKVLDRANVIEFNRVHLELSPGGSASSFVLPAGTFHFGSSPVASLADLDTAPAEVRRTLAHLVSVLEPFNLHFGYRVANEVALYVKHAIILIGPGSLHTALDLQILQKVLPKLHGTKGRLLGPLWQLLTIAAKGIDHPKTDFTDEAWQAIEKEVHNGEASNGGGAAPTPALSFPRSAAKLCRMIRTLMSQGFVSFVE